MFFNRSGSSDEDKIELSPREFSEIAEAESGIIIDVRTRGEYEEGHLSATDHQYDIMNGDFQRELDNLDKNDTYYLYCRSGNRSGKAARMMRNHGFEKAYNIGGFEELRDAGFETE